MTRMLGFFCWAAAGPGPRRAAAASATNSRLASRHCHSPWSNAKIFFQSSFMLMTNQSLLPGLVVERLRERADLRVREPLGRAVGVLPLPVVMQDEHRETRPVAGLGVLQHLPVTGGVAERRVRAAADHEVDSLGLPGVVVVEEQLRLLGQERLAVLAVAVLRSQRRPYDLLGRDAVDLLRVHPNEVLPSAGDDVRLVAARPQVPEQLLHRQVGELGVGALPARVAGLGDPFLHVGLEGFHRHAGERRHRDPSPGPSWRAWRSPPGCPTSRS